MPLSRERVCVVHSSHPSIERVAHTIASVFEQWGWVSTVKNAEEARIPDLTPGNCMIFGVEGSGSLSENSYKELHRSLQGVNLAGRRGALFSTSEAGILALEGMVADSELKVLPLSLVVTDKTTTEEVKTWLEKIF